MYELPRREHLDLVTVGSEDAVVMPLALTEVMETRIILRSLIRESCRLKYHHTQGAAVFTKMISSNQRRHDFLLFDLGAERLDVLVGSRRTMHCLNRKTHRPISVEIPTTCSSKQPCKESSGHDTSSEQARQHKPGVRKLPLVGVCAGEAGNGQLSCAAFIFVVPIVVSSFQCEISRPSVRGYADMIVLCKGTAGSSRLATEHKRTLGPRSVGTLE
ncbi:hypothetical protein B0J13DRAFT_229788 [Dactylonectria estremocensis]|uniref:Uncharacterized protein n=1 Tax=Dactylonectria estremocensis TaxID=1079267 RepID=A0A9P9F4Z3_9HYPO|nr:hypothetical protein B0J13DRAFT_229788 [Dactylonectria estremocensis]